MANKKKVIVKVSHTRAERARLSRLIVSERLSFISFIPPEFRQIDGRSWIFIIFGATDKVKPSRFFLEAFFVISTPLLPPSVENGFDPMNLHNGIVTFSLRIERLFNLD